MDEKTEKEFLENHKKSMWEMRETEIKNWYKHGLAGDARLKESFGRDLIFRCAFKNPEYPSELAFELGMKLLALAAKEGQKYCYSGAADYFTGEDEYTKEDLGKVLEIYRAGVENGDPYSHYKLGKVYNFGKYGEPVDRKKAFDYYSRGAELNDRNSQYMLGKIYWLLTEEYNIEKNIALAKELLEKSSANGEEDAKAWLSALYIEELHDEETAYRLLSEAVAEGSTEAYIFMGICFEKGVLVEKDDEKAAKYFILAAQMDDKEAQKKCKQRGLEYKPKFTKEPRQIIYKESETPDYDGEDFIRNNGITYECFGRFDSDSALRGCYFRILDTVEKKYGSNWHNRIIEFSTLENIFYAVDWFLCEIEEGGLTQYFHNSSAIEINSLLRALAEIGAEQAFKIIVNAQNFQSRADDPYYEKAEKKILKQNLRYFVLDYMIEQYPKDLKI